jgi:hypothetical protein
VGPRRGNVSQKSPSIDSKQEKCEPAHGEDAGGFRFRAAGLNALAGASAMRAG